MFQGTGSSVGKSIIVAGLCRLFSRNGISVAPFKPQNMSNNAAVTLDGGEIGRAQALQARACGVPPSFHLNPVLLKPQTEIGAQLVVQGHVIGNFEARDYTSIKSTLSSALSASSRSFEFFKIGFIKCQGLPVFPNLPSSILSFSITAIRASVSEAT